MASVFKTFTNNDITATRTLLHEAIPITGSIVSGTYADNNIKNYAHKMFQSVYDYPYLSSSANHIFDIALGYSANSNLSASSNRVDQQKKINIYNQMAQVLVGYDTTGSILEFDRDGDLASTNDKMKEVIFLNFARLLSKDEIKKGSFVLSFLTGGVEASPTGPGAGGTLMTLSDYGAATEYRVNSPAGEYGILYSASAATEDTGVGLIYYQAGVAVITGSIFGGEFGGRDKTYSTGSFSNALTGASISDLSDGVRNRLYDIDFNNTIELNSSIYFCRKNHNEFNYSSNPTYLSASKIRVKNSTLDNPVSYMTTIGLYSADNELLAVAKLSEPIKFTPEGESTIRVRLDY